MNLVDCTSSSDGSEEKEENAVQKINSQISSAMRERAQAAARVSNHWQRLHEA